MDIPAKVPLVIYEDGKRKVIGESEVRIVDGHIEVVSAVTTASDFKLSDAAFGSFNPNRPEFSIATNNPHEHNPVRHRDGAPPWCNFCKLTADFRKPTSKLKKEL